MKTFLGFALISGLAAAALGQLNPTVERLPRPNGPVPADCDTASTVAASLRLVVSEIPEPAAAALPPVAPPSSSLRALLRETREAADRGDREAFRIALAGAKSTLSAYPAGAEKRAAEEVVRVYDDLDRLWTYQYETPTGAFFDESSDAYRIVAAYPGYGEAIRRQTLTMGGRRLYPSTESRRFLAAEGARRLGGGKALPPTKVARATEPAPSRALTPVKPRRTASSEQRAASRGPTPKPAGSGQRAASSSTPKPHTAVASKVVHAPAPRTPVPAPRTPVPAPRTPAPATPAPPPPAPTPAPAPATPPPVTGTTATTASSAPDTAPPVTTTTIPSATDTAVAATETGEPPALPAPQKGRRGMIIPVILILIGLGVLVVLFRASSS